MRGRPRGPEQPIGCSQLRSAGPRQNLELMAERDVLSHQTRYSLGWRAVMDGWGPHQAGVAAAGVAGASVGAASGEATAVEVASHAAVATATTPSRPGNSRSRIDFRDAPPVRHCFFPFTECDTPEEGKGCSARGPARQLPDRRAGELALVALRGRHDSLPLRRGHLPRPAAPTTEAEILRHSPFTSSRPATPYEAGTASCSGEGGCSTVSSPPRSSSASFRASFGAGHSMRSRSRAIQGAPKRAVTDPPTWRGQARSGSRG